MSLVKDICLIESLGLKAYSDENKGRDSIILALQDILLMLPDEISAATPEAIVFQPELNTDERVEVENLEGIVAALKQQSSTLERYENDISEVGQKYNIWTDGVPQSDTINAVASSSTLQVCNSLNCKLFAAAIIHDSYTCYEKEEVMKTLLVLTVKF